MEKSIYPAKRGWQALIDKGDSAIAAEHTARHSVGVAAMSAGVAYHGLTILATTLRLPNGTHYVVQMPDDVSVIIYLVSDRKWKQWPRWKLISSLIPCAQIVEEAHPDTHVPRRRLYF